MQLPANILLSAALFCQLILLLGGVTLPFLDKVLFLFRFDLSSVAKNLNPLRKFWNPKEIQGLLDKVIGAAGVPKSISLYVLAACDEHAGGDHDRKCSKLSLSPFMNEILRSSNANKIWKVVGISGILMVTTTSLRLFDNVGNTCRRYRRQYPEYRWIARVSGAYRP
ncbi:hypothetical protein TWF102_008089 [Orbilia oligospora]|uniref:Uncharacterized protein n=1 Tax=Orbilia oligospora TaxID=2813651 RepID=A0A7C8NDK3_ORBOL|nr:hypothetical protein TWF706_009825 [Orbilia oligospora]KAF3091836.1 hypothetical protein TWF103_011398 [Orbilia oligospora]KAF3110512.1 hypothetical protein TWF102_008089 [Orbilia oligospora]